MIVYFLMILSYVVVIYWNAKNYNNGLNINTFLGEDFLYLFELSLGIVLAIYNKEVLLGFLPHEGFPR